SVRATGWRRLAPVSVISTEEPGRAPSGCGRLMVGDCGFGGMIDGTGGLPGARAAVSPTQKTGNRARPGYRMGSIGILGGAPGKSGAVNWRDELYDMSPHG